MSGSTTVAAVMPACQALAELFIASSYAVALFFITPLAIGMSNLGRGLPWTPLIMERMTEAIVGSVVACATIFVGRIVLAKQAPHTAPAPDDLCFPSSLPT
jgi:uncharacterized membrane protein YccC